MQNNRNIYKTSGHRLGCYKDGGSRRLPYWGGAYYTHEGCRELAQRRNHSLYGLQYGGFCFTGNSISRATSYGKLPDSKCNVAAKRNYWTRRTQKLGGSWANDIYKTYKNPKIKYFSNWGQRWYRGPINKTIYGWCRGSYCAKKNYLLLYPGSYGLIPDLNNNSYALNRWTQWCWEPKEPPAKQKYCPDPKYTEWNPAACKLNDSADSCYRTPLKNFIPDWNKCHNKLNVSHNDYDNNDFFQIIHEAFELTKKPNNLSKQKGDSEHRDNKYYAIKYKGKLIENLKEDIKICCMILGNIDEYLEVKQCIGDHSTLDIGKYTGLLKRAIKEIQPKKMKNGKNANQYLANKLKESIIKTVRFARTVRGKANSNYSKV